MSLLAAMGYIEFHSKKKSVILLGEQTESRSDKQIGDKPNKKE